MKRYLSIFAGMTILCGAQFAMADDCQIEITGNDMMQFSTDELTVPASCKEVTLTLIHEGDASKSVMGHNWVLITDDDVQSVANAGMAAGADNNYVAKDDANVIAATSLIGGGEKTSVTFSTKDLKAGQEYSFLCTFPGHWAMMKGTFTIK